MRSVSALRASRVLAGNGRVSHRSFATYQTEQAGAKSDKKVESSASAPASSGGHGIPSSTPHSSPPLSSPTQQPVTQLYRYVPKSSLPASLSLSDSTRPGGRQSVSGVVATVFGSSGFLGRYGVNHLGRIGSQIIAPYRGDGNNVRHLKMSGDLGQIVPTPFSVYDESSIRKSVQRSNIVVNYIGSKIETGNYSYKDVNVSIPYRLAKISKECGVERFIHVSCFGASPDSPSEYFRSKWQGELAVKSVYPDATILRPTTVFGAEDRFLNWIATVGETMFALPTVNNGQQRLQPIYAVDVARAVLSCVMYEDSIGRTYEIAGPDIFTFANLVKVVNHSAFSEIKLFNLPLPLAKVYGRVLEGAKLERPSEDGPLSWLSAPLVQLVNKLQAPVIYHSDMAAQSLVDQVPSGSLPGLEALGVEGTPLLSVIDTLMIPHRPEGVAPERFPNADKIKEAARPAGFEDIKRRTAHA